MTKHLNNHKKSKILNLRSKGASQRSIAKSLAISKTTVQRVLKNNERGIVFMRKDGSGKKGKLNLVHKAFLMRIYEQNHFLCYTEIAKQLKNKHNIDVCANTIKNFLKTEGIYNFVPAKKPLLKKINIEKRYKCSEWFLGMSET